MTFDRHQLLTIFRKEILETLRDKNTLFVNYALPLIIWPMLAIIMGETVMSEIEKIAAQPIQLSVLGDVPKTLLERLDKIEKVKRISLPPAKALDVKKLSSIYFEERQQASDDQVSREKLWRFMNDEKLQLLLSVQAVKHREITTYRLLLLNNQTQISSIRASKIVGDELKEIHDDLTIESLKKRGLGREYASAFTVRSEDVGETKSFGNAIARVGPMILVMLAGLACFYTALQATVGERENGTLSTLLGAPINSANLITGKFLNVLFHGVVTLVLHMASSLACLLVVLPAGAKISALHQLGWLPLVIVSAIFLIASLSVLLSTFAKTSKEGQGVLSTFLLFLIMPAIVTMIGDFSLNFRTALVPITNVALVMKGVFLDGAPTGAILLTIAVNFSLGVLVLHFAIQVFQQEAVLFRAESGLADLLSLNREVVKDVSPPLSLIVFFVCLMGSLYAGFGFAKFPLTVNLFFTQLFVYLLVPMLIARYFRLNIREVFRWRPTKPAYFIVAFVGAVALALLMSQLSKLFPVSQEMVKELTKKMGLEDQNALLTFIGFALLPGICEELAFRGIILSGFRKRFAPFTSVVLTAILFGINHFSVMRFVPTAVVGLFLGTLAIYSRSIFPSILFHVTYNGSLFVLSRLTQPTP